MSRGSSSDTEKVIISNSEGTEGIAQAVQNSNRGLVVISASDPVTNTVGSGTVVVEAICKNIEDSTSVDLQPLSPIVGVAEKIQMEFIAIDKDLCRSNVTNHPDVEWFSQHPNIASLDGNRPGEFTGLSQGVAEIGATLHAKAGQLTKRGMLQVEYSVISSLLINTRTYTPQITI